MNRSRLMALLLLAVLIAAAIYLLRRGAGAQTAGDASLTHSPGADDAEATYASSIGLNPTPTDSGTGAGLANADSIDLYPHPYNIDSTASTGDTEAHAEAM